MHHAMLEVLGEDHILLYAACKHSLGVDYLWVRVVVSCGLHLRGFLGERHCWRPIDVSANNESMLRWELPLWFVIISWKSTLDHWVKPFDTRCALCLCIVPSRRCLMRKSHLHPTMFWLLGGGTNNHMPLRRSAVHQTHLLWLAASDYWYHIEDMGIWILLIYEPRYRLFLYRLNCYNWVLLISCNLYQDKCWK